MRFGVEIIPFGPLAEPNAVIRLAKAAEAGGWELLLLWDHQAFTWGVPSAEPWVILSGVAAATERIRLGTAVTPLPRHRPHVLAHMLATVDRLSAGRIVLGAGAGGVEREFTAFGDDGSLRSRAAQLDEALEVMDALWSGRAVEHVGRFYRLAGVTLAPLPVQRPRIPVWVGGMSRAALERAAGWDGWVVGNVRQEGGFERPPEEIARLVARLREARERRGGEWSTFDVAMTGYSTGRGAPEATGSPDSELVGAYAEAGVTWWLESLHSSRGDEAALQARLAAGPPRPGDGGQRDGAPLG